jgi:serine protease Do
MKPWCPVNEIEWDFWLPDFKNRMRLAVRIWKKDDLVSQYVWEKFGQHTKDLFAQLDVLGSLVENPLIAALLDEFDKILEDKDLYDPERFAHVRIRDEAVKFIGKTLEPADQRLFNRMLLESAYPDDIARSGKITGLAAEIVHFFWDAYSLDAEGKLTPRTLNDFLNNCPPYHDKLYPDLGLEIRRFCHRLIAEGLLFSVGFDQSQKPPYNEQFLSYFFSREMASYGSYEFVAFRFPKVVEHFSNSVVKLVITRGCQQDIGTGFLMEDGVIITAAHCLPDGATVAIEGWDPAVAPLSRILRFGDYGSNPFVLTPSKIDVALLEFKSDPFPEARKFRLWGESTLDDILVMGFPHISGFQSGLIASTGQVISKEMSTARNQPLIIFSASVKGGNSGGPLINHYGKVVGLVTNLAEEDSDVRKLGYGLATPAQSILDLRSLARGRTVKDKDMLVVPFKYDNGMILIK